MLISWSGEPRLNDASQHKLMGQITHDFLRMLQIETKNLQQTDKQIALCIQAANGRMKATHLPYAFVIAKGTIGKYEVKPKPKGLLLSLDVNLI